MYLMMSGLRLACLVIVFVYALEIDAVRYLECVCVVGGGGGMGDGGGRRTGVQSRLSTGHTY